jgi:nitrilase
MARRYQVTLLAGGYPVPAGDRLTSNRAELVGKDGPDAWPRYDKIHLFDVDLPDGNTYRESATVKPGRKLPPVVEVPGLCRVGLSDSVTTCAFLSCTATSPAAGADVLFIPRPSPPSPAKDHWQVLLQARAIENTAYVVAPAQTGNRRRPPPDPRPCPGDRPLGHGAGRRRDRPRRRRWRRWMWSIASAFRPRCPACGTGAPPCSER